MTSDNIIPFPAPLDAARTPEPLRRPALLIRAARLGQSGWKRNRDLAKLLKCETVPAVGASLPQMRTLEAALNEARLAGAAEYDLRRHVVLLIAILAEMRAAAQIGAQAAAPASPRIGMLG